MKLEMEIVHQMKFKMFCIIGVNGYSITLKKLWDWVNNLLQKQNKSLTVKWRLNFCDDVLLWTITPLQRTSSHWAKLNFEEKSDNLHKSVLYVLSLAYLLVSSATLVHSLPIFSLYATCNNHEKVDVSILRDSSSRIMLFGFN